MYDDLIAAASQKWSVPDWWIAGVIQAESSWNPNAVNLSDPGGSRGLMQISGPTAHAYGISDLSTLFDPAVNIDVGTHLLSDLRSSYGDDLRRVYSAYNSGKADLYLTSSEVANNVERVLAAGADWTAAHPAGDAALGILALLTVYWISRRKKT